MPGSREARRLILNMASSELKFERRLALYSLTTQMEQYKQERMARKSHSLKLIQGILLLHNIVLAQPPYFAMAAATRRGSKVLFHSEYSKYLAPFYSYLHPKQSLIFDVCSPPTSTSI